MTAKYPYSASSPDCSRCRQRIIIEACSKKELDDLGIAVSGSLVCARCARELGLADARYEVIAGYLYQRFKNFCVRLWPVGTFRV
ncbi:MAG: hypothetical protein HY650_06980 [Acidobacteria bacterium]|nr:hypothetical protein [Acidobacteriota bacterium]